MARAAGDDLNVNVDEHVNDINVVNHVDHDTRHDDNNVHHHVDHLNIYHDLNDVEFASTDQRGTRGRAVSLTLRCLRR